MSATLRIVVLGQPAPQGSHRSFAVRRKDAAGQWQYTGKTVHAESSEARVDRWRSDVMAAARKVVACRCPDDCGALALGYPLDEPLVARMVFTFARPKSHYRTGAKTAHLLREAAPRRPSGRPDLSHLIKSTEDALTSAGVWRDDSLIVDYTRAAKVYAKEDDEALALPGAFIEIYPLGPAPPPLAFPSRLDQLAVTLP
jgi:Holliday junction resolvase RusA-like endonuclease